MRGSGDAVVTVGDAGVTKTNMNFVANKVHMSSLSRTIVGELQTWEGAQPLSGRLALAAARHLDTAIGYAKVSSKHYARNSAGAAFLIVFGVGARAAVRDEYEEFIRERLNIDI